MSKWLRQLDGARCWFLHKEKSVVSHGSRDLLHIPNPKFQQGVNAINREGLSIFNADSKAVVGRNGLDINLDWQEKATNSGWYVDNLGRYFCLL